MRRQTKGAVVMSVESEDEDHGNYARALGARLRAVRTQQHLSLHGVERKSGGRWKAVVVGSYERGDRAISVQRLAELADFYGVPVSALLPRDGRPPIGSGGLAGGNPLTRIVINLNRLDMLGEDDSASLRRIITAIRRQRGDRLTPMLPIRHADLDTLALLYGTTASGMTEKLVRWQVLAPESLILDGEP
jgi:transcriptional regulator with XRE-family HTH domain